MKWFAGIMGLAALLASCGKAPDASAVEPVREAMTEAPADSGTDAEPVDIEAELAPAQPASVVRCAGEGEPQQDPRLERAASALFGAGPLSDNEDLCETPVHFAAFEDGAALVTMRGTPGKGCHGCSADLSFHTLGVAGDGYVVLQSFPQVISAGTFGDPGSFSTLRIRNMNAVAIEHGGTFQGYSYGVADFVLFGEDGPVAVKQEPVLCLSRSDGGARLEESPDVVEIEGAWRLNAAGDGLIVTQKSLTPSRERVMVSSWRFAGDELRLDGGDYAGPTGSSGCW